MDMCLRLLWSGVSTHTIRVPWSQSLLFRLPSCSADFLRPLNLILTVLASYHKFAYDGLLYSVVVTITELFSAHSACALLSESLWHPQ